MTFDIDTTIVAESIDHYGKDMQATVCMEECAELIQAISKMKRGKDNRDNLVEEIADVSICLEMLMQICNIKVSDVNNVISEKQKRILDRMDSSTSDARSAKKVYISGAITGTQDYMKRFEEAEKLLKFKGYEVINPVKVNSNLPKNTSHEEYMKMSLCMLGMCDYIYFFKGWEKSDVGMAEYEYAKDNDMYILLES